MQVIPTQTEAYKLVKDGASVAGGFLGAEVVGSFASGIVYSTNPQINLLTKAIAKGATASILFLNKGGYSDVTTLAGVGAAASLVLDVVNQFMPALTSSLQGKAYSTGLALGRAIPIPR